MKLLPLLLLLGTLPALAQTPASSPTPAKVRKATATKPATAKATPTPEAKPTPEPKRRRVFVKRAVAVSTPTPSPTPTPQPRRVARRPAPTPTPKKEVEKPEETEAKATPGRPGFFKRVFSIGGIPKERPRRAATPEPEEGEKAAPSLATATPAPTARPRRPTPRPTLPEQPLYDPQEDEVPTAAVRGPMIETGNSAYQSGLPPFQSATATRTAPPLQPPAAIEQEPQQQPPATATTQLPSTLPPQQPLATPLPTPAPLPEFDRELYQKVRKEAAADPAIAAMAEKLDALPVGEAQQAASREYTKALFNKMREIDQSQTDWFNRLEAATLRRIDAGKPFVTD